MLIACRLFSQGFAQIEDSIHRVGIVVEGEAFAYELTESIQRSLLPGNSWWILNRDIPLAYANQKIEWTLQHLPLDF